MTKIKINFVDFWKGTNPSNNYFTQILSRKYEIEISEKPDFLFCSVFGNKHKEYDCTKIWYSGENIRPDFSKYDYHIGYDHIENDSRYLRYPLYHIYVYPLIKALQKHRITEEELRNYNKFCNFIYSNSLADPRRAEFFHKLSEYKHVDSAGRYLNNIGLPPGQGIEDKYEFQCNYKFSIAFENGLYPGYTTEKIVEAFAAKTIPIYWGNPEVAKDFNSKAFINCHDYNSFEEVIKRVEEIDNNYELYLEMLKEPIVYDLDDYLYRYQNKLLEFLDNIFAGRI